MITILKCTRSHTLLNGCSSGDLFILICRHTKICWILSLKEISTNNIFLIKGIDFHKQMNVSVIHYKRYKLTLLKVTYDTFEINEMFKYNQIRVLLILYWIMFIGQNLPRLCTTNINRYHHHHHVVPLARISLTLSRHFSLSFIASGRSSGLHPVSSHSCCIYVRAGRPAFPRPYAGVHRSTSLMSSSLLLQQCPACLVRLAWIVFLIIFINPSARAGCDTRSIFKRSLTGLNSEFSFS